jgi:hypothetical protein
MLLLAISEAAKTTIADIVLWVIAFPALVTGLIVYAIAIARGEGTQDRENRRYPQP